MSLARAVRPWRYSRSASALTRVTTTATSRAQTRAETRTPSWGRSSGSGAWVGGVLLVFVVAMAARLVPVLRGSGLGGDLGYDASVYYAAADGLIHGRLPYRDFVLLHPPAIMLALAPFAAIGRATEDHVGFVLAGMAFTVIGAVNATLIAVIARKLGTSRIAAFSGGIFAAVWIGSIRAEYLTRLEPLANLFVLVGLYGYAAARRRPSVWSFTLMGAALAAATSVKIWYVVPLLAMAGWTVARVRRRRAMIGFAAGSSVVLLAIDGPFFALAPSQMWHMVITEQLGRNRSTVSTLARLAQTVDFTAWQRALGFWPAALVVIALLTVLVGLSVSAGRRPGGRPVVALLGVQLVVLAVAPSWFSFYGDYLTPALAVTVALGLDGILLGTWRAEASLHHRRADRSASTAIVLAGLVILVTPMWWQHVGTRFPQSTLAAAVTNTRCVMSDSPEALIELDALSRSFAKGCRNWVDVTGRTYGVDRMNTSRAKNARWQRDVSAYLLSGNAFILVRSRSGLSAGTRVELRARPVLARSGSYVIYRGLSTSR